MPPTGLPVPDRRRVLTQPSPLAPIASGEDAWASLGQAAQRTEQIADRFAAQLEREQIAADAAYRARVEQDAWKQAIELQNRFDGNPEGFRAAWQGYSDGVLAEVDPRIAGDVQLRLDRLGIGAWDDIADARRAADRRLNAATLETQVRSIEGRLERLAMDGRTGTPEWDAAMGEWEQVNGVGVGTQRWTAGQVDIWRQDMPAKLEDAAIQGLILRDPDAALELLSGTGTAPLAMAEASPGLIRAVVGSESGALGTMAESPRGAAGLMQVMPGTARAIAGELGEPAIAAMSDDEVKAWLKAPENGMRYGTYYLNQMLGRYGGNVAVALAAYNAGPGRADAWIERFGMPSAPDEVAAWVEQIPFAETRGYVRDTLAAAGGSPVDIPPGRRVALAGQAQRAIAERQATRQADVEPRLRDETAAALLGRPVDRPLTQDDLNAAYGVAEGAERWQDLDATRRLGRVVAGIALMTPGQIEFTRRGWQPEGQDFADEQRRADILDQAIAADLKSRADDPAAHVARYSGAVQAAFAAAMDDPAQLGRAVATSLSMQAAIGIPEGGRRPLTRPMVDSLAAQWDAGSAGDRTALLGTIADVVPPGRLPAVLEQVAGKRPVMAMAARLIGEAPEMARSIVAGDAALAADKRYAPADADFRDPYYGVDGYLGDALAGAPEARALVMDAVRARYADLSAAVGDTSQERDDDRLEKAVADVTGGIVEWNGHRLIAPRRGMDQSGFDDLMDGLDDVSLGHDSGDSRVGGRGPRGLDGGRVTARMIRRGAVLHDIGPGEYLVEMDGQFAIGPDGMPYILDLRP
jgi:hypothetical protein